MYLPTIAYCCGCFCFAGRSGTSNSAYNPQSLLSAVCCHAPVFKGKQQHDAHELMRMLLDGLQVRERKRGGGAMTPHWGQERRGMVAQLAVLIDLAVFCLCIERNARRVV